MVRFGDRKAYQMQYVDPLTGKKKTRTTGTNNKREAERKAVEWETELLAGTYREPSKVTWGEFRSQYEKLQLPSLADRTTDKVLSVFNSIEKVLRVTEATKLRDIDAKLLTTYAAELRLKERSEQTIACHLAHFQSSLRWAEQNGLIAQAPKFPKLKRVKGGKVMKGRPITTEEFERMLAKVAAVQGDELAACWQFYLRGLWWSGLRLEESLELYWDRQDRLCVDLSGGRPMLWIPAECEKGNQDRMLPMAPEFAEFLLATPEQDRRGRVFRPLNKWGTVACITNVSKTISAIGKAAGVKVNTSGKLKFASAHDLRRSFGERWSVRVMPAVLQQLMRHESIDTTMRFYVGRNAQTAADQLWAAYERVQNRPGNGSGNTEPDFVENRRENAV
ncbi:MAG: site-specific integrase [Pirellulales bacterium]